MKLPRRVDLPEKELQAHITKARFWGRAVHGNIGAGNLAEQLRLNMSPGQWAQWPLGARLDLCTDDFRSSNSSTKNRSEDESPSTQIQLYSILGILVLLLCGFYRKFISNS